MNHREDALRVACRALNLREGISESDIEREVATLLRFDPGRKVDTAARKFEGAGSGATKKELEEISKYAASLISAIDKIHAPAHNALFDRLGNDLHTLRPMLEIIAAPIAVEGGEPPRRGRKKHLFEIGVANVAAAVFARLTGSMPTVSTDAHSIGNPAYGEFLSFLRSVLNSMGIEAGAENLARMASSAYRIRAATPEAAE